MFGGCWFIPNIEYFKIVFIFFSIFDEENENRMQRLHGETLQLKREIVKNTLGIESNGMKDDNDSLMSLEDKMYV